MELLGDRKKDVALLTRIQDLLSTTPDARRHSIKKVPSHFLYEGNFDEKLYEPQLVSIGPYHRGKDHLKVMEADKIIYLQQLLGKPDYDSLLGFASELRKCEPIVRGCYAGLFDDIKEAVFVEMMLLDGCFIVKLILQGESCPSPLDKLTLERVKRDLVLLENQLPFFLLLDLFHKTSDYQPDENFIEMATKFFSGTNPGFKFNSKPKSDVKHLLGLLHNSWFPSREDSLIPVTTSATSSNSNLRRFRKLKDKETDENGQFIPSATQLKGSGIQFKKIVKGDETWLFDISFDKGIMQIPVLNVNDDTESILRNLVVYEQSSYKETSSRLVTDYIILMDCLINTEKDVELLCRCGIIDNWLGDHEVVASMFNRLRLSLLISEGDFFYTMVFKKVNKYYNENWNKWKANLNQNYFNTPWSFISFLAALFLLVVAVIQAVYAILSYSRANNSE